MEYEPQEGVDYIVDLYAVVGVNREASEPEIKHSIRERMTEYHPDRLEGLAPEFRAQGQEMTLLLNRANEILLDTDKRRDYDEILEEWQGPVSESGFPIIRTDRIMQAQLEGVSVEEIERSFAERAEKIAALLGYAPQRLEFLQRMIDASEGELADDLRAEYEAALLQKDQALAVEEAERAQLLGLPRVVDREFCTTNDYAALVSRAIEDTRQERQEEAERLAIGGVASRLALLAATDGEGDAAAQTPATFAQLEALPPYFDDQAAQIKKIATEREAILETRLSNLVLTYPSPEAQTEYTEKLALGIEGKEGVTWIGMEIGENDTAAGSTLPEDIEALLLARDFRQVIDRGYNVATLPFMEQIEITDLVRVAAGKYTDGFPRPASQPET